VGSVIMLVNKNILGLRPTGPDQSRHTRAGRQTVRCALHCVRLVCPVLSSVGGESSLSITMRPLLRVAAFVTKICLSNKQSTATAATGFLEVSS